MFWPRIYRFRNNNQCFSKEYVDFATIGNVLAKNMLISQQPAMCWERFGHALGMFWACVGYCMFWQCFGYVLAMCWACFGNVLCNCWLFVGHDLGMFWACFGYVLGMFKQCFSHVSNVINFKIQHF